MQFYLKHLHFLLAFLVHDTSRVVAIGALRSAKAKVLIIWFFTVEFAKLCSRVYERLFIASTATIWFKHDNHCCCLNNLFLSSFLNVTASEVIYFCLPSPLLFLLLFLIRWLELIHTLTAVLAHMRCQMATLLYKVVLGFLNLWSHACKARFSTTELFFTLKWTFWFVDFCSR